MNMKFRLFLLLTTVATIWTQHEDIPYQDVENICETCVCTTRQVIDHRTHYTLNCADKNFKHILARWPQEFGINHNGIDIVATFSSNTIDILQQLPATNASLTFSCRQCDIKFFQVPTFMDVPNIKRLDLSWNKIRTDELTPDVFRGPYRANRYEPITLTELDLSHNQLHSLNKRLFEHTPNLTTLNLSYNNITVLDMPIVMALSSANSLKILDLSHIGIKTIPATMFKSLSNLRVLNLAGNVFRTPPDLHLVGKSLMSLNLAGNNIEELTQNTFLGMNALVRLNISDLQLLNSMEKGIFTHLQSLEYLWCSHNPELEELDLQSLTYCKNFTYLDISYCKISTISMKVQHSSKSGDDSYNATAVTLWPKLHTFETIGNPWRCDCELLQSFELIGAHKKNNDLEIRCETPYILSGARLSNLTSTKVCSMQIPRKYSMIDEDPPRFLRKRYIILTVITTAVVIGLGLIIGFMVVCIRRRLKRDDFGVEPIRYTSVRSSNLSAFSHSNANGNNHI